MRYCLSESNFKISFNLLNLFKVLQVFFVFLKYVPTHGPISVNGILSYAAGSRKTIAFYDFLW